MTLTSTAERLLDTVGLGLAVVGAVTVMGAISVTVAGAGETTVVVGAVWVTVVAAVWVTVVAVVWVTVVGAVSTTVVTHVAFSASVAGRVESSVDWVGTCSHACLSAFQVTV